jgi:hypothetical protein
MRFRKSVVPLIRWAEIAVETDTVFAFQIARPDFPSIMSNDSGDVVDPRPHGETSRRKSVSSKAKEVVTIGK